MNEWLKFFVAALAAWRVTHLVVREDGPWCVMVRLRASAGEGFFGKLMDCFYCTSLWTAAIITAVLQPGARDCVLVWLAVSGAACLLDRMGSAPVMVERIGDVEGGAEDGMLRTKSRKDASDEGAGQAD
jgi:hypothetical protein